MLALSVSISTSSSPLATESPSDFSHLRIVPSSIESDRRGMETSAMAPKDVRFRLRSRPPRRLPQEGGSEAARGGPALLDAAEPPHRHGPEPGQREQPDHQVADGAEVDLREAQRRQQLERADAQRDGHREPRDREVVVELAHRLG